MIEYKYCPQCRRKLSQEGDYPVCKHCNITFYKNSKPTAGVLIVNIKERKVLLAIRGEEPYIGQYDIIGGFLNWGEHPIAGVIREVKEETGLEIELLELLGMYTDVYLPTGDATLNIYFIGTIKSGEMEAKDDVAALEWVSIDTLPLPIGKRGFPSVSRTLKDLKTWFDELK